jgi:DNA-binding NarL/FixJ family response regulator
MMVMVVEDNDFTRMSIVSALEASGVTVVGACARSEEALTLQERTNPDAALLDLNLGPGPTGLDLAHGLRKRNPALGIVFLTHYTDPRLIVSPGQTPPLGSQYVVKNSVTDASVLAIALAKSLGPLSGKGKWPQSSGDFVRLTTSQVETLKLLAEGLTNREIALRRSVSEKSVEKTIARVAKHLGVSESLGTNQRVSIARAYFRQFGE